jgi:UDP-glucose 4-epimerase
MSPYAVSKLAAESYAIAYAGCSRLGVLPFRFFNVLPAAARPPRVLLCQSLGLGDHGADHERWPDPPRSRRTGVSGDPAANSVS